MFDSHSGAAKDLNSDTKSYRRSSNISTGMLPTSIWTCEGKSRTTRAKGSWRKVPCSSFRFNNESFDSVVFIQFAPAIDSINASRFVASDLGPATDSCYYVHDSLRLPSPQLLRAGQASETGGGGHFRHHGRTSWANDRHPADLAGQVASVLVRTILFLAFVGFFYSHVWQPLL